MSSLVNIDLNFGVETSASPPLISQSSHWLGHELQSNSFHDIDQVLITLLRSEKCPKIFDDHKKIGQTRENMNIAKFIKSEECKTYLKFWDLDTDMK